MVWAHGQLPRASRRPRANIHQGPASKAMNGIGTHDASKKTLSTGNLSWARNRDLNGLLVYDSAIVRGLVVARGGLNPNSLL